MHYTPVDAVMVLAEVWMLARLHNGVTYTTYFMSHMNSDCMHGDLCALV